MRPAYFLFILGQVLGQVLSEKVHILYEKQQNLYEKYFIIKHQKTA